MEIKGYEKFLELRKWFMEKLEREMTEDHKSYEGSFELLLSYPGYFDVPRYFDSTNYMHDEPDGIILYLHCYVIGPKRHYKWYGRTIEEATTKARAEIESWGE